MRVCVCVCVRDVCEGGEVRRGHFNLEGCKTECEHDHLNMLRHLNFVFWFGRGGPLGPLPEKLSGKILTEVLGIFK